MLAALLSILTGGGFRLVSDIVSDLNDTREKIAIAKNDKERVELERQYDLLSRQLEVKQRAQSTFGVATIVRLGFAFPFMAYLWKLIIWDKIWMAGTVATAALGQNEADLMQTVVSFYFLTEIGLGLYRGMPFVRR